MKTRRILGDVSIQEDERIIRFSNGALTLAFSRLTGGWTGLENRFGRIRLRGTEPTLLLTVGGRMHHTADVRVDELQGEVTIGRDTAYVSHEVICRDRAVVLEITKAAGAWTITDMYRLTPRGSEIRRDFRLCYQGGGEELLRGVQLTLPVYSMEGDSGAGSPLVVEAPGYPVPSHFPVRELPEGSWPALRCWSFAGSEGVSHAMDAPGSMPGLAGLHDPEGRLSLLCWPWSTSEPAWAVLERRGDQIEIGHRMELADRFAAGHVLEAGSQYVSVRTGSWEESLRHFQGWYGGMPLHVPENVPSWAAGAAIYEVHVGRAPFPEGRDHEPYASIGEITEDLSRIKNLGFEIVQLMPHWPFPGYSVDDYLDIDAQYGSEAELKELVRAAHRTGLKIILDVVLHGCIDREIIRWNLSTYGSRHSIFRHWLERARDRSPYRDEHPEWFQLEEDGDTARVYTWAFDTASHSYQDFIIRVCREYADRLGIDGFRFDAPTWNMFPNWKRDLPYRASASFYGAYELFQRLRKALAMEGRELLLFTEPSGPLFRACAHACYNYDEEWISGSLMPIISDRGYAGAGIWNGSRLDAHQLSEWLHYRRLVLPPGAITVHHLDSHDTFWWGGKAQFRREAFGASAARVLFSFFALLGGGIMIYAGAERGEESFYEQLLKLRRQREALRLGDCAFLTARSSSPNALALWRSWRGEKLLVVLNFTETALETAITFPLQEIRLDSYGRAKARDLLDGSFVGECRASSADGATEVMELMVPAYGTRILEFESGTRGRVDARST